MASKYEKKNSPFWWMDLLSESGERVNKSTGILIGDSPRERRNSGNAAQAYADEEERNAKLRREGKLEPELNGNVLFEALAAKYMRESAARLESCASTASRLKHLVRYFTGRTVLGITTGDTEAYCTHRLTVLPPVPAGWKRAKMASPSTVEHERALLRRIMNFARAHNMIRTNPVTAATEVDVPEAPIRYLELEQVQRLIAHAPEQWRSVIAVALYCGLRKGEVFALHVRNVDLARGVINVERSHARNTTKGGKPRVVPIPPELLPILKMELGRVRSVFLFPGPKGERRSKNTKTEEKIRQAAVAAGLVEGFDHLCRRASGGRCSFETERRADDAPSKCPKCGMRLWVRANPIDIQFKDTRSTYATHAYEATGDYRFVQDTLGHWDDRITTLYTAKRISHLAAQASKISYNLPTLETPAAPVGGEVRRLPLVSRGVGERAMGESNPRPLAPEPSGGVLHGSRGGRSSLQSSALGALAQSHPAASPVTSSHLVSYNLPTEPDRLLLLPEVAARLGGIKLSAVRGLIWAGQIPEAPRVRGRVCVRESDLAAFIAKRG